MKAFILKQNDLDRLLTYIDRNPEHGRDGGSSSATVSEHDQMVRNEAHRFYNYQVRKWIGEVEKDA